MDQTITENENIRDNPETQKKTTRREILRRKAKNAEKRREETDRTQLEITRSAALDEAVRVKLKTEVVITGVEEIKLGDMTFAAASAFTEIGGEGIKLTIPFREMMTGDVIDMSTIDLDTSGGRFEYFRRQQQMLSKFLGLTVSVCITDVAPDPRMEGEKLIIASRRAASERLVKKTFLSGDGCREGEICTGTVMTVGPHSLLLSYGGVDTVVQQGRLTYRYVPQLDMKYRVNDRVDFIMRDLQISGEHVSFKPDPKGAELISNVRRLSGGAVIFPGTKARGIITSIRRKGSEHPSMQIWLPDYELPAYAYNVGANWFGSEPKYADEVLVSVDEVKRDRGYLSVRIVKLLGSMSMFSPLS